VARIRGEGGMIDRGDPPTVILVKRTYVIDLEFCQYTLEEGKTYYDDGTTIFNVYISGGLAEGWLEKAIQRPNTITVTHPSA
jgi:hypothetical protein